MPPVIHLYDYSDCSPDVALTLRQGEIHIWKISCPSHFPQNTESASPQTKLLPDERSRMEQFAHPIDKLHYALGHTALRNLLHRYTGSPTQEICIVQEPHGKPYWKNPAPYPAIEFNLSHSGKWILLAFSLDYRLGIDTEQIDTGKNLKRLAQRFYHPAEVRQYENTKDCQKPELFFRCWTIKEAYLKGIGEGLLHPTSEFYVNLTAQDPPETIYTIYSKEHVPTGWYAQHFPMSEGYAATIAYAPIR